MISLTRTPTRLIDPAERPPVVVEPFTRPSSWRSLRDVWVLVALVVRLVWLWLRRRLTAARTGIELRTAFERLGGLWVKTGQLLSLRIDLFPVALCDELAKLQHSSVGFPVDMARAIVERELGGPIDAYFDEFGERPFAVASIGQVFRARLRHEQAWVAVKVQRPHIDEMFRRDFAVIRAIVVVLQTCRIFPHVRWDLGLQELREVMEEEIDYYYEASNIRRLRRSLKPHGIFVPKLYGRYCTRRLLVTEFIHGVLMADYIKEMRTNPEHLAEWLNENNIRPKRVARRLMLSMLRQLLEDNLYHGDLHPGNIVMLRDSRIALIDFGTASFTEHEYLERFRLFVRALAERDYSKAADLCLMLAPRLPTSIDLDEVKEKLMQVLRGWTRRTLVRELPYHTKSLEYVTVSLMRVLHSYRCTMEWAWLRIHRAFTTLDMSLVHLYPDVNYSRMLQRYFAGAEVRSLQDMMTRRMTLRSLAAYRTTLDIQERVNEYTMFQGKLMRRHAQLFEGATDKFAAFLASLVMTAAFSVLMVEAVAIGLFLDQHHPSWIRAVLSPRALQAAEQFPRLDYIVWIGILGVLSVVGLSLVRTARLLRQKEIRSGQRVVAV